jgi:hypothetical protein
MYEGMHLQKSKDTTTTLVTSLRPAAAAGLEKLESYYSKGRNCQLNIIATCTCIEEWWNNFDSGVNRLIGSSSMTVKQNFSGFWKTFGDELVKRDLDASSAA